jgi:glycosyltransferase involved in cell wall biosynthesis
MRVLVMPDRSFIQRERSFVTRLEIGLADEGVRVLEAVPERSSREGAADPRESSPGGVLSSSSAEGVGASMFEGVFARRVGYADEGLPFTLGLRVRQFAQRCRRVIGDDASGESIDVVHCLGEGSWAMGARVAARFGSALLLEAWRSGLGPRVRKVLRAGASREGRARVGVIAPEASIVAELGFVGTSAVSSAPVLAPWGVHLGETLRGPLRPEASLSVALLLGASAATRASSRSVRAALAGLSDLAESVPGLFVFADADAARRVPLWRWARASGLGPRLTLLPDLEAHRELVLQSDVLMVPEALGEQRSIVLEAMGAGVLVVASADARSSALIDGQTCVTVSSRGAWPLPLEAKSWEEAVMRLVNDAAGVQALRFSARRFIEHERLAFRYIRAVLGAYERLAARVPMRA